MASFLFFLKNNFGTCRFNCIEKEITMTRDFGGGTILTFILGAGVGATLALLFAPKTGEALRGDIADGVSDGVNHARRIGKDLKLRTQKLVGLAQDHVQDAVETAGSAYSEAKKA